jgi:hypothetical protein
MKIRGVIICPQTHNGNLSALGDQNVCLEDRIALSNEIGNLSRDKALYALQHLEYYHCVRGLEVSNLYKASEHGIAMRAAYVESEERKARRKATRAVYYESVEGKAKRTAYYESEVGKLSALHIA